MRAGESGSLDPATIAVELENLILKMGALGDSPGTSQAQELVRLLMSLYGAGLSRMLDVIRTEGGGSKAVLDRFANDGLIASLLVLHDLHPHALETRVERALASLQPHVPSHMTLTLVGVSDDIVRLRIAAAPGGHPGAVNLRASVERAVQEVAPEIRAIHIEGLDDTERGALIQIVRRSEAEGLPKIP